MPRGRDEMQVNVAGLRRNIKNLAHNYSDAQVKVREATSNDPWGPSSTLMTDIADLTYNVMAFTEIMQMIWKRLNDHGKNWRHVYKALVLLDYLIKTGSDRVALQCKENIYAIHTLKDFQHMEEGKDQGLNVREKAKQLVTLLKDEERLKAERDRAMRAKQRFAQCTSGFGSDGALDVPSSPTFPTTEEDGAGGGGGGAGRSEAELARPLTAGEEELQLQLALAMSREEAERDERRRRSDDVRLQLALSQSQHDFRRQEYVRQRYLRKQFLQLPPILEYPRRYHADGWPAYAVQSDIERPTSADGWPDGHCNREMPEHCWLYGCLQCLQQNVQSPEPPSHLLDLLDVNLSPGASAPPPPRPLNSDPWALPEHPVVQEVEMDFGTFCDAMETSPDAWSGVGSPARDPWAPAAPADPWAPAAPAAPAPILQNKSPPSPPPSPLEPDQFEALSRRPAQLHADPFELALLGDNLTSSPGGGSGGGGGGGGSGGGGGGAVKKSPSQFLGENSSLVNLERLLQPAAAPPPAPPNPFAEPPRPFAAPPPAKLTINELKQQQMGLTGLSFPSAAGGGGPAAGGGGPAADPWAPAPAPALRTASPWSPQNQRHTPNPFLP